MFVILIHYTKPLETIDQYLAEHRQYLQTCYTNNQLLVSGPKIPRTGGVLISHLKDRYAVEKLVKNDPFYLHDVATYEIIEFNAVLHHPALNTLLS